MRILLTNDDGYNARGIIAAARALSSAYDVIIVAPKEQKSGASQAVTTSAHPLYVCEEKIEGLSDVKVYSVSGTPADCVRIALGGILDFVPDFAVSGINIGRNLGADIPHSGTVGAAREAASIGVPSLAVSILSFPDTELVNLEQTAGYYTLRAVTLMQKLLDENEISKHSLWNMNCPDLARTEVKGVKWLPAADCHLPREYHHMGGDKYAVKWSIASCFPSEDCDARWSNEGYVTLTPICVPSTDYAELERLKKYRIEDN